MKNKWSHKSLIGSNLYLRLIKRFHYWVGECIWPIRADLKGSDGKETQWCTDKEALISASRIHHVDKHSTVIGELVVSLETCQFIGATCKAFSRLDGRKHITAKKVKAFIQYEQTVCTLVLFHQQYAHSQTILQWFFLLCFVFFPHSWKTWFGPKTEIKNWWHHCFSTKHLSNEQCYTC